MTLTLVWGGVPGKYGAVGVAKVECWVVGSHNPLRLLFYIPVCFALAYAIYVLVCVWNKQLVAAGSLALWRSALTCSVPCPVQSAGRAALCGWSRIAPACCTGRCSAC